MVLQFLAVRTLKLLDSFPFIIGIFISCLVIGSILYFSNDDTKKSVANQIGWGLFYGSLTTLALVVIFMIWFSFNLPR